MDLGDDDLSPLKRYKSDPSLFKMRSASVNQSRSPQSDHSENQASSCTKHVRRHLVARRLSASNLSPRTIFRIPSRLDQIKFEESVDKFVVEAAHEKEIQSAINMSKSWEHLCLSDTEPMSIDGQKVPSNSESTPFLMQSSSPARACISPLAMFSTSSSSPLFSASRSSPITVKHTLNLAKRKLNVSETFFSPAKKILLSPGIFHSISLGNAKIISDEPLAEEARRPSFQTSQSSSSSSPLICYSDGSSSPSLDSSQSLSFQTSLALATGREEIPTSEGCPTAS